MTSHYDYYTQLRKTSPFTVEIVRIENQLEKNVLLTFDDTEVMEELSEDMGNYYSWMAYHIKIYIKTKYNIRDIVKCVFYSNYNDQEQRTRKASIVINCNNNRNPIDEAPLYQ